jgi:hypothetical protein
MSRVLLPPFRCFAHRHSRKEHPQQVHLARISLFLLGSQRTVAAVKVTTVHLPGKHAPPFTPLESINRFWIVGEDS